MSGGKTLFDRIEAEKKPAVEGPKVPVRNEKKAGVDGPKVPVRNAEEERAYSVARHPSAVLRLRWI
jgi:hypothetical protein